MIAVSANYRKLSPDEVPAIAAELDGAWKSPEIPLRQWISVVRSEVERYRNGEAQPHFDVLVRAMKRTGLVNPTVLDVGASSGFYRELMRIAGVDCQYHGCDYSQAYKDLAEQLWPGIQFTVGDARSLPFADSSFAAVLSGNVILHVLQYEAAIAEAARVASQFVILHKTPVWSAQPTTFYEKSGYGVRMMEIHFNEADLFYLFDKYGLSVVTSEDVHAGGEGGYSQRTYLLAKGLSNGMP